MSYIKSSNIEVFPVAKQRSNDAPGTRIFTEKNISNISRQLLSNNIPGYIISCVPNEENNNLFDISFNLYGYYFNITEFDPDDFGENAIYASIVITDGEIDGQDRNEQYEGLKITSTEPSATADYEPKYIKLFEKVNDSWQCVSQNFGLMSALLIGGIDGKPKK